MKLTQEYLETLITGVEYIQNGKTTICIARLINGFEIVGTSAVVDKTTFDEKIGRQIAKNDVIDKLWELESNRVQWIEYNKNNIEK